jgi:Domain of unknown function (DUF4258)
MKIDVIIRSIQNQQVRITDHADEEAENDQLSLDEVYFSVFEGEIIESYWRRNQPYPRCLIYGQTPYGEDVHSIWAYNEEAQWAVLVTVYRPDPAQWIAGRKRRT